MLLADLGADVVKIEPPGGTLWERHWSGSNVFLSGVSAFFLLAHRNQRSLTLDLKKPEGLAVARRLVESADVLVQNFRPGVMERLGLGWDDVSTINPRLIYASASGYGESSPYRDRPGQDLLMQAFSGLASISGRADQPPTPVGTAVMAVVSEVEADDLERLVAQRVSDARHLVEHGPPSGRRPGIRLCWQRISVRVAPALSILFDR